MEGLRVLALAVLAAALVGCGEKQIMSSDVKPSDPYAALTGQQKVDAIRNDPKISSMQRSTMISKAQQEAGLPVTGQ